MTVDLYSGLAGTISQPRPGVKPKIQKKPKKTPKKGG